MNIPLVKVPTFKMTLPFTQREVKYRPYVVKEEKILIMASESETAQDMVNAVGDVVKSCTFGAVDYERDPLFEVQYAFLQIRGKSQGEVLEFYSVCGKCKDKMPVNLNVSEFTLKTTEGHTYKISLPENVNVIMRYPTLKLYRDLYETEDENVIYDVVAACIETIYNEDETFVNDGTESAEFRKFIDNLTPEQFEQFERFFVTMPVLIFTLKYNCSKCEEPNTLTIDGINHFFE